MPNEQQFLIEQKDAILSSLVDLSARDRTPPEAVRFRAEAHRLIDRLKTVDKLLSMLGPPVATGRFAKFRRAIDAVEAFLRESGQPMKLEEIIEAIREGGFPKSTGAISRSVGVWISGPGMAKDPHAARRLKEIHGLVGLISWDDSLFESSR